MKTVEQSSGLNSNTVFIFYLLLYILYFYYDCWYSGVFDFKLLSVVHAWPQSSPAEIAKSG